MSKIKGIPVVLHIKKENGVDEFGAVEYTDETVTIDNVLVSPSTTDDITTTNNLTGNLAKYTLCIPKGDTNDWTNTIVEFFGKQWKTTGLELEYIEDMLPLDWNKKVTVMTYE